MPRFRIEVSARSVARAPDGFLVRVLGRCDQAGVSWHRKVSADVIVYEGEADDDLITDLMMLAQAEW
jgi:hypothetical protein